MRYLITGGTGFVGSSLAICLKDKYPGSRVIALDNLKRRGGELNLPRLKQRGIEFIHGDIRNKEDLICIGEIDCIIECSAEPSVLAGYNSSPEYLVNTNLLGTVNCLELARTCQAAFVFLSTSRVYPYETINKLNFIDTETRFELANEQDAPGCSQAGFAEDFPLAGLRSLYGTTKLASELLIAEYAEMYGFSAVINRCSVLTGPWQFGKTDQGVFSFWVAKHCLQQELNYIGFGGEGKQVRDILHVNDLFRLVDFQLNNLEKVTGEVFNVGGGRKISVSLIELTELCRQYTGNIIHINKVPENRPADVKLYLTDNTKVTQATRWSPEIEVQDIIQEITEWIKNDKDRLSGLFR